MQCRNNLIKCLTRLVPGLEKNDTKTQMDTETEKKGEDDNTETKFQKYMKFCVKENSQQIQNY